MKHILFTGGGSAGHVVPNLALMNALKYSHRVTYMGTGGIEKGLVTEAGFPFFQIECPKLRRAFTLKNLKIPLELRRAEKNALAILQKEKPDLVFSKGGYVSYPAVWAAHKLKIPVLTHESDLSPGLCTKLIAKKCTYVLTSFPETAEKFKNGKYVGSPIRREIFGGEKSRARHKFGLAETKPVLLVLGGGSGSRALNDAVRKNLSVLLPRMQILHLCGRGNVVSPPPLPRPLSEGAGDEDGVIGNRCPPPYPPPREGAVEKPRPREGAVEKHPAREGAGDVDEMQKGYIQREFERDMGGAFAAADVVLSRAGSNTVFEILALKKPAVLVPLAHASRGDQIENALYFERRGLVKVLSEDALDALPDALFSALSDDALRSSLAESSFPSGTDAILAVIREVEK